MEMTYPYPGTLEPLTARCLPMTEPFRKSASIIEHIWKGKDNNLSQVHTTGFFLYAFIITTLNFMLFNALETQRTQDTQYYTVRKKQELSERV